TVIAQMWDIGSTERAQVLEKYDIMHTILAGKCIDRSRHEWRDVTTVIQLRNAFLHYKPKWVEHGPQLDRKTPFGELDGRFAQNALSSSGNAFYPDKLLGHGCAQWCLGSAIAFTDKFCSDIGII